PTRRSSDLNINTIDLVVVNLYPFEQTVANPDCTLADAIENIDIGGPTMVRAAAKNHAHVSIVTQPQDYDTVIAELDNNQGQLSAEFRLDLAVKAFEHTASYYAAIANYFGQQVGNGSANSPRTLNLHFEKVQELRYDEHPRQATAFYREANPQEASIATATQLQGTALSYNNIADTDAALECVKQF